MSAVMTYHALLLGRGWVTRHEATKLMYCSLSTSYHVLERMVHEGLAARHVNRAKHPAKFLYYAIKPGQTPPPPPVDDIPAPRKKTVRGELRVLNLRIPVGVLEEFTARQMALKISPNAAATEALMKWAAGDTQQWSDAT